MCVIPFTRVYSSTRARSLSHNHSDTDAHDVIRMCMQIPAGSVTKTWTGVAVLQAVARGDLSLETPAHVWVDPPLLAQNKTSMSELWGRNPQVIRNMTLS